MTQTKASTGKSFRPTGEEAGPAPKEVELKLELDAVDVKRLKALPELAASRPRSVRQRTVYFDTAKAKVRKAGCSLRVRSSGDGFVQTVKPLSSAAGMFSRDEWEVTVDSLTPDLGKLAGTPLAGRAASGQLADVAPVVDSQVRRTTWMVGENGHRVRLDLDEGNIAAGGRKERFVELELELLAGEPRFALDVAQSIAASVPVRIGVLTKAERGFALAEGTARKVSKAAPVAVDPDMTVAEGFVVIAHACLRHFRLNEPVLLEKREAGALHQSRVAMRRLRSAFTLFKRTIADDAFPRLREELRWFTNQLGDARNLDVFLQRDDIAAEQRDQLIARREAAYDEIAATLGSQRLRQLMLDLVCWLEVGAWRSSPKALRPLPPFARKRLSALWRGIEAEGAALSRLDEESRHELRIQVKKLRYALEFFAELFRDASERQKAFAAEVEELQEALGHLNDMATARTLATGIADAADGWAAPDAGEREQQLLKAAERHVAALRKIGPYWAAPKARKQGKG